MPPDTDKTHILHDITAKADHKPLNKKQNSLAHHPALLLVDAPPPQLQLQQVHACDKNLLVCELWHEILRVWEVVCDCGEGEEVCGGGECC